MAFQKRGGHLSSLSSRGAGRRGVIYLLLKKMSIMVNSLGDGERYHIPPKRWFV